MAAKKPSEFTPVDTQRHSAAHILAAAIMEMFPEAKLGVGPVIENGFFYDVDVPRPITKLDLQKLEARMAKIMQRNPAFVREELPLDDAIKMFKEMGQDYKVELLTDLKTRGTTAAVSEDEAGDVDAAKPDVASVYRTGNFVDLCRGPHVASAKEAGVIKLRTVAGAYWRGKQENPQMQRIYGLAFPTREELEAFEKQQEEAEKRDHRKLGQELDLFVFSELVGPGLPLFTPRGQHLRSTLDQYVWDMRRAKGYERVEIPHITKKDLYEKSGHWAKYKDDLFRFTTREGHEFAMKPMNCPHHTQIFDRKQFSYREMPQRYANSTMCYRDEQTGELSGLSRVRAFAQDDAHVFCRVSQVKQEAMVVWDIIHEFYGAFGFDLKLRLSLSDPKHPEKYLGEPATWATAEQMLREIATEKKGTDFVEGPGEAAFYGPKLDFMAKDSIGRTWQVATIQLDFVMPERFDLTCQNEKGEKERIVMIHCAIMGSFERFMSVMIEHVAGNFPAWLAPTQVQLIPVSQEHVDTVAALRAKLEEAGLRVAVDAGDASVGYGIRKAAMMKIPYMLVVGEKEKDLQNVAVRIRGAQEDRPMTLAEFIAHATDNVKNKTLLP